MTVLKQAGQFDIPDIVDEYALTPGSADWVSIWLVDFDNVVLDVLNVSRRVLENYKFETILGGFGPRLIRCDSNNLLLGRWSTKISESKTRVTNNE